MPKFSTLGFRLIQVRRRAETFGSTEFGPGRPYVGVEVRPLIDGEPLCDDYVFDSLAVLVEGLAPAEFDIYTCKCGAAACIGIFEACHLEVSASKVIWRFPDEPFRDKLKPAFFRPGGPLVVRFERAQYETALRELEHALTTLVDPEGLPIVLEPNLMPDLAKPVAQFIAEARARAGVITMTSPVTPTYLPQSDIDDAVALFEQLLSYAHSPQAKAHRTRELEDIRTLMNTAAHQAPDTLHDIGELQKTIHRNDESEDASLLALFELLPYLCGAKGPYEFEFHYRGARVSNVVMVGHVFDIRDEAGNPLPHEDVIIRLRRRARPASALKEVEHG